MIAPWIIRPKTRAVSLIGSPRPSWMSAALRNITWPPSSRMPTSKDTRVRRRRLGEHQRPALPGEGLGVAGAVSLEGDGVAQHQFHVAARHLLTDSKAVS